MNDSMDPVLFYTLREMTLCRRLRAENACLLTVKAVYPRLVLCEDDNDPLLTITEAAAERINTCYEQAAEAFAGGGLARIGEPLRQAYDILNPEEKHSFSHRVLLCRMQASLVDKQVLEVRISRFFGTVRGGNREHTEVLIQRWLLPHGFLLPSTPKSKKSYEKLLKNQG